MLERGKMERGVFEIVDTESLVPPKHLLRKIDAAVDFTRIYDMVEPLYCLDNGRPSIDPVVLFKMVLIQHLYGLPSLRRTAEEVSANMCYRWFLGYRLQEETPHFSTISYNFRHRFTTETVDQIYDMRFQDYFPIWDQLQPAQQQKLLSALSFHRVKRGTIVHDGSMPSTGLFLIRSGQLRAYIFSEGGREITIYRLFDRDMCLFSAACILRSIQFDVTIQAEKETELWSIPPELYRSLMAESAAVANYINELIASRFSEVMWLIEQVMWTSLDRRLAAFLCRKRASRAPACCCSPMRPSPIIWAPTGKSSHGCCATSRARAW